MSWFSLRGLTTFLTSAPDSPRSEAESPLSNKDVEFPSSALEDFSETPSLTTKQEHSEERSAPPSVSALLQPVALFQDLSAASKSPGADEREPDSGPRLGPSLSPLVASTQACAFQPMQFFVAWQGVLTLAFVGIPPAIEKLKASLQQNYAFLPSESPGSKWPKASLACLRDDKRLSLDQLQMLQKICSDASSQLSAFPPIQVDQLSVVLYENCCLERVLAVSDVPLMQPLDSSSPSEEQASIARSVVDEFSVENLPNYWFHASKDGNRSTHYKGSRVGATIVHFLHGAIDAEVERFRSSVEEALPGMYDWFLPDSLHVTIRGLT